MARKGKGQGRKEENSSKAVKANSRKTETFITLNRENFSWFFIRGEAIIESSQLTGTHSCLILAKPILMKLDFLYLTFSEI